MTRKSDLGLGYGGSTGAEVVRDRTPRTILDIKPLGCTRSRLDYPPQECRDGLGMVHVDVTDAELLDTGEEVPNAVLVLDLWWQTGDGGADGSAGGQLNTTPEPLIVDCTRGTLFAISATDALRVDARFTSSGPLLPDGSEPELIVGATKRVEATVKWGGSINPKKGYAVLPQITLAPDVASEWFRIPKQVRKAGVLTSDDSRITVMTAEFAREANPGAIAITTVDPVTLLTPIVAGVEWMRVTSPEARDVFFYFKLWI